MPVISFEDFCIKYDGVKVDFDKAHGFQCVDLFRKYNEEVNGYPHTGTCAISGGAKDLYLYYDEMPVEKKYYKKVKSNFKPKDVLVWDGTTLNKMGHVALFMSYFGKDKVIVLEQDGLKQDGTRIRIRSTKNLLGALRPNV